MLFLIPEYVFNKIERENVRKMRRTVRNKIVKIIRNIRNRKIISNSETDQRQYVSTYSLFFNILRKDKFALVGICIIIFFLSVGILGEKIAPFSPQQINRDEQGKILTLSPPTLKHPFGTTNMGRDVLSMTIVGTRVALVVGIIAAFSVTIIGTTFGLLSGYYGGWIDLIIMRVVDILYGIPLMPSVLVLIALLGANIWNFIIVVTLIAWRGTARIIRSQVLSLRERPFVKAAKVTGASDKRILFIHILPNVIPLVFLQMTLTIAWVIITEASISFIGFGDPQAISWGQVLHMAFLTGSARVAWWWIIPPGFAIMSLCLGIYFFSRTFEAVVNPRLREL